MQIDEETYLEHYGVKGMKWGVRKSKRVTGVGRLKGAKLDRDQRHKAYYKERLKKNARGLRGTALTLNVLPRTAREAIMKQRIKKIDQAAARMKAGKSNVSDMLGMVGATSLAGVFVSVKPKKS